MLNGIMPWEGTESIQAKENTELLKIEGDEPKGTMEMRNSSHLRAALPGSVLEILPSFPRMRWPQRHPHQM